MRSLMKQLEQALAPLVTTTHESAVVSSYYLSYNYFGIRFSFEYFLYIFYAKFEYASMLRSDRII